MKKFKKARKALALLLSFSLVLGMIPASAITAFGASGNVIDAAIFCSDVHGSSSSVSSAFSGIKNADSTFAPSTATFVGDTQMAASSVTSAAQSVYSDVACYYAYGNHDSEGNYGIEDKTGLLYGDETKNYYIYAISQTSMASSNPDTTGFTSTVEGLDKSKPLFIASHLPLHDRRGDSKGAAAWYEAISAAAEQMDIVFFWAHNHTGEDAVDRAAFYVAKDGDETITLENTSTVVTPNFTYMNAGFVGKSSSRGGVVSTVKIYEDSLVFQDYKSSGAFTGEYSHNVEVTREFASKDSSTEKTLSSIAVTTKPAKTTYEVGEKFDATGMVVTATYSDGTTEKVTDYTVSVDTATSGVKPVNVTYGDKTVTFNITVNEVNSGDEEEPNVPADGTLPNPTIAENVSGTATTTTTKTVYVLTSSISAGNEYLIANRNSAGSTNLLANNNGSVAATSTTIKSGDVDGDGDAEIYIELDDATDELWTVSNSYRFQNSGYYLRYNNGLDLNSRNYTTWSYSSNKLSYRSSRTTYYLRYNEGWTTTSNSSSASSIYFYVPTEVEVETTTTVTGTYSIAGTPAEVSKVVVAGTNATLGSALTFVPKSGTATTTDTSSSATYTIYDNDDDSANGYSGDPSGIISSINGNIITFTGNYGTAYVKVSYKVTVNGNEYLVDNYITVVAKAPTYSVVITETKDDTEIAVDETIAIKGVKSGDPYDLNQIVYYEDSDGKTALESVDEAKITWSSSNTNIAKVSETGLVTFTGNEGTVQIAVYYEHADNEGNTIYEVDVVTFSVSKNQYVVPSDGTGDFPEYPDQGSIRFDKTATAVGNFSQTGIANVELSMTGVPYGTSAKTDVVVMVDMTSSMEDNDITAAKLAVQELIETLVYDEENDVYDDNIQLFVSSFSSGTSTSNIVITDHLNNVTISSADELTAAKNKITDSTDGFRDDRHSTNGTHYGVALADVYATLNREGAAEKQYVVFVTDGVPTRYYYLNSSNSYTEVTGDNSDTKSLAAGWFDDDGEVTASFQTEYYTYLIKNMSVPVYTIGANLSSGSDASDLINHMSSNYSADGKTATGETKYSFTCTTSGGITDEVLTIFKGIGQDIKEAATNVVVEDKIADEYTMNFSLPSGVTADEAGMDDFYIQVVGYELDDNNERKENPTVIEKLLFNSDGTITHTIGSTSCGDTCTHVTYTDGVVTAIDGTYFDYNSTSDGEFLTWKADKLDRTELVLEYFVYLDNSAGLTKDQINNGEQVAAGTYPTNEYATLTYTNFNGNECQQYFPVPSLTWNGAQVTYVFYLVNENGQPVNRAGKVIPFAEAVYVTDPVTYDVTWNEETGSENMLAENLFASANVPDVYELYDQNAYYEIRVYQTEGVDQTNNIKNYNYFIIDGSDSDLTSYETTKVYNTKAGTKYDDYGVYSAQAKGSTIYTTSEDGTASTVTVDYQTTDIDYANTTVAFAVVWKPVLVEDTVVVDYGLDVVIDVYENDGLAAGVTGVSLTAPTDVEINKGSYADAKKVGSASITSADGVWTASKESLTSVRFTQNEIGMNAPIEFYYEAGVNYYTYDESNKATLNTTNMYSSVTVIPATTIYYEDEFVSLKTFTKNDDGTYAEAEGWDTNSVAATATQDVDRPGENSDAMSALYDADNLYGYDSAYTSMSEYSMGNAAMVNVYSGKYASAEFDFYGTGFDVISLTSNSTGTIFVTVTDSEGETVRSTVVDTYYGYTYNEETKKWEVTTSTDDALYQVPVITTEGLEYGQYHVVIKASYGTYFDHNTTDTGYDFYLDAIRIYNPCGSNNADVNSVYVKDHEGWPVYEELRDNVIESATLTDSETQVAGLVFIDGIGETAAVADYSEYGPNNELYLAPGEAIAFDLDLSGYVNASNESIVDTVQIGLKTEDGTNVSYKIFNDNAAADQAAFDAIESKTLATATDMYYDITDLKDDTIVICNAGSVGMLSVTNIKVTFTENPGDVGALCYVNADTISNIVSNLNTDVFVPEKFEVSTPESVVVGNTITVTVTTSKDVAGVKINDELITSYVENEDTLTWTAKVSTSAVEPQNITAVAYKDTGLASEKITKSVTVNSVTTTIANLIKSIISWLKAN